MTTLTDRLRARLEFDGEAHLAWLRKEREETGLDPSPQANARYQHAKDRALIEALVECAEQLMAILPTEALSRLEGLVR